MYNIIKTEFRKLKGSNIVWICIAACFILPTLSLFVGKNILISRSWDKYCTQSMWMSILLFWPCIFGIMGTYIFTRERIENTYKNLLVIPVNKVLIAISKLFVLFVIIMGITMFSYILNMVGIFIGVNLSVEEFFKGAIVYLGTGILSFIALLPIMLVAIISKKSFLVSICITLVYSIISFIGIWSSTLSSFLPIISILRICNITELSIDYTFPIYVNVVSFVIIGALSFIGIIYVTRLQEI